MTTGRPRLAILLTEGSSLSARQTLDALGPLGHAIDLCDPRPWFGLARHSRFVRAAYRCPSFTADPLGYLRFLVERLDAGRYDVLFPTHDQVYLLARFRDFLAPRVGLAVPDFAALEQLQSKATFINLLDSLRIPHPATVLVRKASELERACRFPCYVKLAFSTAGCGVWQVRDARELHELTVRLDAAGQLTGMHDVLVQQPAPGTLCVVQSVFQNGRLLAAHTYQARALGVGGSARARVSVSHPVVLEHLRTLGEHLHWHGALMLDYLHDPAAGPAYIDANPRIGETGNATRAGLNLCELLAQVALANGEVASPPRAREGVRTHSVLMSLLALAQNGGSRRGLLAELWHACRRHDLYADSSDELTHPRADPRSLLPALWTTARLLVNPRSASATISRTVDNYALNAAAVEAIRAVPLDAPASPAAIVTEEDAERRGESGI